MLFVRRKTITFFVDNSEHTVLDPDPVIFLFEDPDQQH